MAHLPGAGVQALLLLLIAACCSIAQGELMEGLRRVGKVGGPAYMGSATPCRGSWMVGWQGS